MWETAAPLPPAKFTPSESVRKASPTLPGGATLQPEAAGFAPRGQYRLQAGQASAKLPRWLNSSDAVGLCEDGYVLGTLPAVAPARGTR